MNQFVGCQVLYNGTENDIPTLVLLVVFFRLQNISFTINTDGVRVFKSSASVGSVLLPFETMNYVLQNVFHGTHEVFCAD